jgi:DNA-directed RNA polymerase beta' subunit
MLSSQQHSLARVRLASIAVPTQDMVLGLYYLTKAKTGAKGEGRVVRPIPKKFLIALEAQGSRDPAHAHSSPLRPAPCSI